MKVYDKNVIGKIAWNYFCYKVKIKIMLAR